MEKPEILITGATGTIGSEICQLLSQKEIPFRAMSRKKVDASNLKMLKGAEIVVGDFEDPKSLEKALQGIKHAFLLTNSSAKTEELQTNFINAAKKANLEHIVKLSQLHASKDSPVRFLRYHAVVEQKIKEAKINYTFLRPNLFMQALLGFEGTINEKGMFFATIGDAKVSLVDTRDIARVAVEALQGSKHYNKVYDLTGPEALTHHDIAERISKAMDKKVQYVNVPDEQLLNALLGIGFPEWQAHGLIEDYAHYARGEAEAITQDVKNVTGKNPYSLDEFLNTYIAVS